MEVGSCGTNAFRGYRLSSSLREREREGPSFTLIRNKRQNYEYGYSLKLYSLLDKKATYEILCHSSTVNYTFREKKMRVFQYTIHENLNHLSPRI